jgi:hypothetical protein
VPENSLRIAASSVRSIVVDQRNRSLSSEGRRERIWRDRFNGVATKYLPDYFGWRQAREKAPRFNNARTLPARRGYRLKIQVEQSVRGESAAYRHGDCPIVASFQCRQSGNTAI